MLAEPRRATGNGACARSGRKKGRWEEALGSGVAMVAEVICMLESGLLPHLRCGGLLWGWTGGVARKASLPPPATALQPYRAAGEGHRP